MKSALLLKVLGFIMAGSVLAGGGVLAGMTLAPQRDTANLIPTPVVGSPVEPNQNAPTNDNMSINTAVSRQPPVTGMNDNVNNQTGTYPNAISPGQSGYGMQGNGNMGMNDNRNNQMNVTPNAMPLDQPGYGMQGNDNMGMNGNWDNQMSATPNALPPGQSSNGMQGNGNMGMGNNWEMNGRDDWGMGGMNGNGNMGMGDNSGMGDGMNGQGYSASLIVSTLDKAAQVVQDYLANLNNPDLILAEIVPYGEDYYAHIYQQSSGQYAFSLMVDAYNGQVWPVNGGQ